MCVCAWVCGGVCARALHFIEDAYGDTPPPPQISEYVILQGLHMVLSVWHEFVMTNVLSISHGNTFRFVEQGGTTFGA